jgi:hypothetical protein
MLHHAWRNRLQSLLLSLALFGIAALAAFLYAVFAGSVDQPPAP